jgi:peptidoglycan/xylan/chitin deacetylase (PgdA/CDA1 family)
LCSSFYLTRIQTWFTPAHSAESFPQQIRKIIDAGHEIGLHGYTHEFTNIVGKKPRGWTAPAWSTSKEIVGLLEEAGIVCSPRHWST